ncbi:cellulose synthase-like protein G2 isoform X2 [Hibiscus syriacus]|uniref:cellulose synthase-like protein G2 isoform X2 n=1 Tax=Hibiscus syriacus TaxID=106335 RepID=UPI001924D08A|nr:cellulose synthase-like protein G2 isoform X2 [Hibiscus syriacus]
MSGTNYYIKREALLGNFSKQDLMTLKRWFGPSTEFIKTLVEDHNPNTIIDGESSRMLLEKANVLATCSYENQTTWGTKVGFMYFSVLEDYFTGFTLPRKSWKSVYLYPKRPQFLGISTTNVNEMSIQWMRWMFGLVSLAFLGFPSHLWIPKYLCGSPYGVLSPCIQASSAMPLTLGICSYISAFSF